MWRRHFNCICHSTYLHSIFFQCFLRFEVQRWIENFRGLRQKFIATILNKDSSKKYWLDGTFPMETEMWRSFIVQGHIFRCLKLGFRHFSWVIWPFFWRSTYRRGNFFLSEAISVDFDQRYSAYPTPTYASDSVSVAKNSKDMNEKTKSARNFIYTLIR